MAAVAILGLCWAGCGPSGGDNNGGGPDVSTDGGSSFERTRRYPGYCRGMVQRDLDGKADGVEYGRFDGDVLTHREFDSDRDGDIDQRTDFFYNSDDLVKAREVDEGPDGDVDTRYEYDYNAEGSRTFEHIDEDGDGEIETVIKFKHNDRGLRVVGTGRSSETNEVELVMNHKWTKGGLLDLLSVDGIRGKPDKEADRLIDYIYDEHGNVDQGRFDYDANGRADLIVIYKYECWGSGDGN